MSLKLQSIEQRLITLLAYHQKLVVENVDKPRMDRVARMIKRLLYLYETGLRQAA